MKRIKSKQTIIAKNKSPDFEYRWNTLNDVLEIPDEHAEILLKNSTFYLTDQEPNKFIKRDLEEMKMEDLREIGKEFDIKARKKENLIEKIIERQ